MRAGDAALAHRQFMYDLLQGLTSANNPESGMTSYTPYDNDGNFKCRLLLEDIGPIPAGGGARVPIKPLRYDLLQSRLHVGSRSKLREIGAIGEGIVEQICQ